MTRSSIHARAAVALVPLLFALAARVPPAEAARWFDAPIQSQPVGGYGWPRSARTPAVADLNGDDRIDAVVPGVSHGGSSAPASIGVYLGLGDGTFGQAVQVPCSITPSSLAIADFDGDGAQDIAYAAITIFHTGDVVGVLFGDGTGGGWTEAAIPAAGPSGYALAVGDFDEDGRNDIAVAAVGRIDLFSSRAGRAFSHSADPQPSLGELPTAIRAGDLDLDGHADLVLNMPEHDPEIAVLFGRGDGTFEPHATDAIGAQGIDVADVTGDGIPDIVFAQIWRFCVLPGRGDRTFGPTIVGTSLVLRAWAIVACDVTGDGLCDVVIAPGGFPYGFSVFPGTGSGSFGPPITTATGVSMGPLVPADLDADERADFVGLHLWEDWQNGYGSGFVSALGDGVGGFWPTARDVAVPDVREIEADDFDEDGRPDLFVISGYSPPLAQVLLGEAGRGFRPVLPRPQLEPAADWNALGVGDFDLDGHADVLLHHAGQRLLALLGTGTGQFSGEVSSPIGAGVAFPSLLDVDADGVVDLAFSCGDHVGVMRGRGDGSFAPAIDTPLPGASAGYSVEFGDLDGDGHVDVASDGAGLVVAYGSGEGQFGPPVVVEAGAPGVWQQLVMLGDVNGDGRIDMISAHRDRSVASVAFFDCELSTRLQQADGSLGPAVTSPWQLRGGGRRVTDLDGDGARDLIYDTGLDLSVARGDGVGHFEELGGCAGVEVTGSECSALADFDLDGRLDFVAPTWDRVRILWGRDPIPPTVALLGPGALPALTPGAPASIRWLAHDDLGVASIDLFVSRHGPRGPFARIAAGLADTGEFPWTVTGPLSDSVAFKIVARDSAGNVAHAVSAERLRIVDPLAVGSAPAPPARLAITALAPNPAHARCAVRFALPQAGRVTLALHDLQGRRLATLLDAEHAAGEGAIDWTLASAGAPLRPGLYFLRLTAGRERAVARLVIAN